jgi:thiol-disulfide isomerase/thioredoxin
MRRYRVLAVILVVLSGHRGIASPAPHDTSQARHGVVHALLINGGSQPASNYLSHLQHLQEMVQLLRQRGIASENIHVFSADGQDPAADLATRSVSPPDVWLIEDTTLGKRLKPAVQLIDTVWNAVNVRPARLEELRRWFDAAHTEILPGDRLLAFVTDHGGPARSGPGSGTISLWREQLTVREFRLLLDRLSPQVQVVTVMSQCYSGAFADLMYDHGGAEPSGNTCGFFATSAEERAFGCYPEGQARDRIGYAFEFIEALGRFASISQAHLQVVRADSTPDRPRRTSDAYLSGLVAKEAAARHITADELADSLLATAWRRAATYEPEIRLLDAIGDAFGTFSPRSLAELKARERDLASQADRLKTYSDRWNAAFVDVKESVLRAFAARHAEWRTQLDPRAFDQLAPEARAATVATFLDELNAFVRQTDTWPKLERFRNAAARGSEASWRFEVRKAAADRMGTILMTIAGRELLETPKPDQRAERASQQHAFEALLRCESIEPGTVSARSTATAATPRASFPSLSEEAGLLQELRPSWLGIRYGPVPSELRQGRLSLGNAARIQGVEEGSPAAEAGLETGDIVLGPPDQPFESSSDIRNWTMISPRDAALPLKVLRPGTDGIEARELDVSVYLRAYPADRIETGEPPRLGSAAPALAATLKPAPGSALPDVRGRAYLLFFWATWCGPCKASLPEVRAFAAARDLPVLAVTDEDQGTVSKFLSTWTQPFFEAVAIDSMRKMFIAYGVSGTPTMVLVDADGVVRYRQVGYSVRDGLKVEGWHWARKEQQ